MYFEQYLLKATTILILKSLDVFPNLHIGKDKSWLFWYVLILQGPIYKHILYSLVFCDDKIISNLNMVYLNKHDINIKSKMSNILTSLKTTYYVRR